MIESKDGQSEDRLRKKYLWFGFGNYGGQPIQQIGGGSVRDPDLLENLYKTPSEERSQYPYFVYIAAGLVALTLVVILVVGVISLFVR